MLQLQMDLAVQEQRYEDAVGFRSRLTDIKLRSQPLRLVSYVLCFYLNKVFCCCCYDAVGFTPHRHQATQPASAFGECPFLL